jgi:streptomycin 6-kinase
MSSRVVTRLTDDQALPALAQALDVDLMLPLLARAVGLNLDAAKDLNCSTEVINHKSGQRCVIHYTLAYPDNPEMLSCPVAVIGKLYRRRRLADRIYRWTHALADGPLNGGELAYIPAPLMLVPDLGLVLQEYVGGADLRHPLSAGCGVDPLYLTAQWLARLHTAPPLAGLKIMSLRHELGKVHQWCQDIAPCLSAAQVRQLLLAEAALYRLASEMPPYAPVTIHKDFYYANVLWDSQRIWVLDFDQLSIGDSAFDVGHFLAHLENLAYRTTGWEHSFTEPATLFIKSYLERVSTDLRRSLPFDRAYTFLKLAATEVSRKHGEWARFTEVLTDLAYQEVCKRWGHAARQAGGITGLS